MEIKGHLIKRNVVHATSGGTGGAANRVTFLGSIFQSTFLIGATSEHVTCHDPTGLARAALLARGVEHFPGGVVVALVVAATLGNGDTSIATPHKAVITHAAFPALGGTGEWNVGTPTGPDAVGSAGVVVAILSALRTCTFEATGREKGRRRSEWKEKLPLGSPQTTVRRSLIRTAVSFLKGLQRPVLISCNQKHAPFQWELIFIVGTSSISSSFARELRVHLILHLNVKLRGKAFLFK